MEQPLVERAGIAYRGIETGQLHVANPLAALANLGKMAHGVRQSLAILDDFRPQVCLATGGYVCAPVVVACRRRGVPVLIYLPDMTPGWAIRLLSKLAQRVAVSFPEAAVYFGGEVPQGKAVVTGYPVRDELVQAATDRSRARRRLAEAIGRPQLRPLSADDLPLLLVWGGSQGSRSINQATWGALPLLLPHAHVVHVVGQRDWPLYLEQKQGWATGAEVNLDRYHAVDYLHEAMPLALAAADLSVARAGASTLGEFPVAGLPSILVPLPIGGVNQMRNAEQLARHGAAIILDDADLGSELGPQAVALLQEPARLAAMAAAAAKLAKPGAAQHIAAELARLSRQERAAPAPIALAEARHDE
jgi:UDP-N-acetylglucosamine--N-acetylmuramyl-(pentapeptide) pyrophosphoryl-undecaprenol N-acetylglucosamine transferase